MAKLTIADLQKIKNQTEQSRRLREGGTFRMATDWEPYSVHMLEIASGCAQLRNASPDGGFVPRPESRPVTRFERRGQRLGHGVWDLAFTRT